MSSGDETVEVTIRVKDNEIHLSGSPRIVLDQILSFFAKVLPTVQIASRIALSVDIQDFLAKCEGVLAVTPEDVVVLLGVDRLTDKELVLLQLVRARIGFFAGRRQTENLATKEIVNATAKSLGTVAGRLSEICAERLGERIEKGEYRVTTFGLHKFAEEVLPKLKGQ